ncbi:MAG: hypothetical protein SCALA701_34350 [Candidatus Scalindua sp.]|nr:MAG: hypothetical protein SCALA701_34350 [Candidatus Scalindua sp.]
MKNKRLPGRLTAEMVKRFLFDVKLRMFIILSIALFGLAFQQREVKADIDLEKDVYLFLHASFDLEEKSIEALVANGFSKERIIVATPRNIGKEGDYMAMLWLPPKPDHIKIQQITKVVDVEPEGMIGYWKGVTKEELYTIPLELE